MTKYHRQGDLNNKHLFLTALEAGSPRSRSRFGGWSCFLADRCSPFTMPTLTWQKSWGSSLGSLPRRAWIPFVRLPPSWGVPGDSVVKNLRTNAGDAGNVASKPGSGRSPGGDGNPLQYSCLENPMDRRPTHLPKTPPPDAFTLGIRLRHTNLWEHDIQSTAAWIAKCYYLDISSLLDALFLLLQLISIACLGKNAAGLEYENAKKKIKTGHSMCKIYFFNIVAQSGLTRSSIILTKIKI